MHSIINISLLSLALFNFYACSVQQYIPEDEYLYRGGTIHIQDSVKQHNRSDLEEELNSVLYPEPNATFLGMHPGLHYYYKAQDEDPGFITRFLNKKIGEGPVYLSDVDVQGTQELLQNRLENNGFFYGDAGYSVKIDSTDKTAKVDYTVQAGAPFRIATYQIERDTTDTLAIYDHIKESLSESVLEKGQPFSLNAFTDERERINDYVKHHGHYSGVGECRLFEADKHGYGNIRVDLDVDVKVGSDETSIVAYVRDGVEVSGYVHSDAVQASQDTVIA